MRYAYLLYVYYRLSVNYKMMRLQNSKTAPIARSTYKKQEIVRTLNKWKTEHFPEKYKRRIISFCRCKSGVYLKNYCLKKYNSLSTHAEQLVYLQECIKKNEACRCRSRNKNEN